MTGSFQSADVVSAAQGLIAAGRPDAALRRLQPVMGQLANDPVALDCAAVCYWQMGDGATALALMQVITDGWPHLAAAWSKRGALAASTGQKDLAKQCLRKALALEPQSVGILAALNRVAPFPRNGALTRRLRKLAAGPLAGGDRVMACNALARIEERAGRYSQAFRYFAAAKATGGRAWDPAQERRAPFRAGAAAPPDSGPRVVFVVGMPRSGTTLIESILSRHPRIVSAGESRALSRVAQTLRAGATLTAGEVQKSYLQHLEFPAAREAEVILDKMPLNILDLDVVRWAFPRARVICMDRHPMDVGLSCFSTNFHRGNGFSHRLDWIAAMIRLVDQTAQARAGDMGARFRRQSYRALVDCPEPQIRDMLRHLDLPFHADCLSPEAGSAPVRTASVFQVRRGINRDGLGKWLRYRKELQPLADALGQDWLTGWEARDCAALEAEVVAKAG